MRAGTVKVRYRVVDFMEMSSGLASPIARREDLVPVHVAMRGLTGRALRFAELFVADVLALDGNRSRVDEATDAGGLHGIVGDVASLAGP